MSALDDLAAFFNDASHGSWLLAAGVIAVLLTGSAVAWVVRRLRSVEEMADPSYNPDLDRHEDDLRRALAEVDRLEDEWHRRERGERS